MKILKVLIFLVIAGLAVSCSKKETVDPLSKYFSPKEQIYTIDPSISNTITGNKGTRLTIPEKAFDLDYEKLNSCDKVKIKLTEVIDNFDFASSGVNLDYELDGEVVPFESAGMFKVNAELNNKTIKLMKDVKITVQFPNVVPGEKFNVYKMNSKGKWEYDGHNQEAYAQDAPKEGRNWRRECEGNCEERVEKIYIKEVQIRKYLINELTWWNFDYPEKIYVCLKGSVDAHADKYISVYVIGISKKGHYHQYIKGNSFTVNAFMNTEVKVVVITEDDKIGLVKSIKTGNRYGNSKKPEGPHNYYNNIGEIRLEKMNEKMKSSREEFMKFLEMKDEKYKVKYL